MPRLPRLAGAAMAAVTVSVLASAPASGGEPARSDAHVVARFDFAAGQTPENIAVEPDGSADLSFVLGAATEIADRLLPGSVVVNKSTVPVGSAALVSRAINRRDVFVVSNPEFLREGSAVQDALNPHRIVVGGDNSVAVAKVVSLFERLNAPVVLTDSA